MKYTVIVGLVAALLAPTGWRCVECCTPADRALTGFGAIDGDMRRTNVVDELLAADRAFAAASAKTDLVTALVAMFAENVTMPVPGTLWAEGIAQVTETLRANPDNGRLRAEWSPVRGGMSADG